MAAEATSLPAWVRVWRDAITPLATVEGLQRLLWALKKDDERLIQGATTKPPPLRCVEDWECEGACAIGFLGWEEGGTVGTVEEFFASTCYAIDQTLGEPAGCRHFICWTDETPRTEMRRLLIPEVERSIQLKVEKV